MLPIIERVKASYIVEIGSDTGINTKNILKYCIDHDAHMTAIDPLPGFDVDEFKAEYGDKFEIYKELSLSRLPLLKDYDVILIDGDHNWYTVYNELKTIERQFKGKKFPLIFLHDVCWPYGRRDLYYNPENIPETQRQPYKKLGVYPGQSNLKEKGGLNEFSCNSIYENTPKNGVLTAIEQFIDESELEFSFETIEAFFGLGILYPKNNQTETIVKECIENADLLKALEYERSKVEITYFELKDHELELAKNSMKGMENQLKELEKQLKLSYDLIYEQEHLINTLEGKEKDLDELSSQISKLQSNIYENEYLSNKNRSFSQKIISKLPSLYIFFNRDNNGFKQTLINIKGYKAIKKNKLFDTGYYLLNNIDVRTSGMDPLLHYIYHGFKEGRRPNSQFNTTKYMKKYSDVKRSNMNPLIHYSLYGIQEKRGL